MGRYITCKTAKIQALALHDLGTAGHVCTAGQQTLPLDE